MAAAIFNKASSWQSCTCHLVAALLMLQVVSEVVSVECLP